MRDAGEKRPGQEQVSGR